MQNKREGINMREQQKEEQQRKYRNIFASLFDLLSYEQKYNNIYVYIE